VRQVVEETLPALRRLQEQGKVRWIGVTGYWPGLLARIAEQTPVDTVLNYCHANLLMDDMERELVPATKRLGIGLLNASPLHMGLLGGGAVPAWHPAPAEVRGAAEAVVQLCDEHGVAPATVAMWHCLQQRDVASTFLGFQSVAQVDAALEALRFVPSPELLGAVEQIVQPVFNTVWASGLAENQPAGDAK
jgi:L-galactose dehydrogenase